ncbi:MAG: DinB family protein [Blastocatellia bacterium]|nr:DinB family protein [Blastocatellia bacterium]
MDKQEYIEKLNTERQNFMKTIEGLSDEEMCEPMGEDKWAIRDVLGHLAAWEGEAVKAFEQKASGQRPTIGDIKDFDAWNKVEADKRKDRSLEENRQEFFETRKRFLTILNDLPEDEKTWDPNRMTVKLVCAMIEHECHHAKAIQEYRHGRES